MRKIWWNARDREKEQRKKNTKIHSLTYSLNFKHAMRKWKKKKKIIRNPNHFVFEENFFFLDDTFKTHNRTRKIILNESKKKKSSVTNVNSRMTSTIITTGFLKNHFFCFKQIFFCQFQCFISFLYSSIRVKF